MDNENEVKDLVEQSKLIFLKEIIREFQQKQAQYDLAEEFAKTRKNRSLMVSLVVLGMIVLFALGAIGVTLYIQESSRNIAVNISDFEDVNLRDVLDTAKRLEENMRKAQRELADLQREMQDKIQTVNEDADRQLALLQNESLTSSEKDRRIGAVETARQADLAEIEEAYAARIAAKEAEIAAIQEELDQYDTRQVEQAREQEEVLNNQQQLFDIELENTVNYYEERITELTQDYEEKISSLETYREEMVTILNTNHAGEIAFLSESHKNEVAGLNQQHADEVATLISRYNPVITDGRIPSLLDDVVDQQVLSMEELSEYREVLGSEGLFSSAEYRALSRDVYEYNLLVQRLQGIPYINSVDPAVDQIDFRGKKILQQYESFWNKLTDSLEVKNVLVLEQDSEIKQYEYALTHLININAENGYILDARDTDHIMVALAKLRNVSDGTIGYVFRRDDEFIGTVRFQANGKSLSASLIDLASAEKPLEPYDKILVQVQ
jgi:hypothetical protein